MELAGGVDRAVGGVEPTAGGWRVEVGVPAGSRWFVGHFPGHPLLPAVAQLDLVERLLARLAGPGALVAVERLRLPAPVGPGDRLLVELARPGAAGRTAFSITRDGETTCDGTVAWRPAPAGGAASGVDDPASADAHSPYPASSLLHLPHRHPALLVTEPLASDPAATVCLGRIPEASPLVRGAASEAGAGVPALAAIELAAQTAAVREGLGREAAAGGGPRIGYLVRVRGTRLSPDRLAAGTGLTARVVPAGGAPPLRLYRFEVSLSGTGAAGGPVVAAGTLGTWLDEGPGEGGPGERSGDLPGDSVRGSEPAAG
jgi:3-hydroxyacyl-[acyl-carrier-protein] dehydratase